MNISLQQITAYLPHNLVCQFKGIINGKDLAAQEKEFNDNGHPFDFNVEPVFGTKTGVLKEVRVYKNYWKSYIGNNGRALKSFINGHDFKPCLLPFSKLTKEQLKEIVKHFFKDSQTIRPCYNYDFNPIKCESGFITFYDDSTMQRYTAVKPGGDNLPVLNMSNHFSDYEIFFKLHVDIFGLIDAGLAIDKTTL